MDILAHYTDNFILLWVYLVPGSPNLYNVYLYNTTTSKMKTLRCALKEVQLYLYSYRGFTQG